MFALFRPFCRRAIRIALVLATLLPTTARAQSPDPIAALLEACTTPAISLAQRFQLLDAAQWRTPADSRQYREMQALTGISRFPALFRDVSEQGVARLRQYAEPIPWAVPPGLALSLDDLAAFRQTGTGFASVLVQPDVPGLALLSIDGTPEKVYLRCDISLAEPLAETTRAALIERHQPLDLTPSVNPEKSETFTSYLTPKSPDKPGDVLKLVFFDMRADSPLHLLAEKAGFEMRLTTLLKTNVGSFPLEVTP